VSWDVCQPNGNGAPAEPCALPVHVLAQPPQPRHLDVVSHEHTAPAPRPSLSRASTFPTPGETPPACLCSAGSRVFLQSTHQLIASLSRCQTNNKHIQLAKLLQFSVKVINKGHTHTYARTHSRLSLCQPIYPELPQVRLLQWTLWTTQPHGRPRKRWMDNIKEATEGRGTTLQDTGHTTDNNGETSSLTGTRPTWIMVQGTRPVQTELLIITDVQHLANAIIVHPTSKTTTRRSYVQSVTCKWTAGLCWYKRLAGKDVRKLRLECCQIFYLLSTFFSLYRHAFTITLIMHAFGNCRRRIFYRQDAILLHNRIHANPL